jgi:hypothetical protein
MKNIYIMSCDARNGMGTDFILVAALDEDRAYDYMAALDVENIGCIVRCATAQDVADFLVDSYDSMAMLCTV